MLDSLFFPQELLTALGEVLEQNQSALWWYTALVRFVFPILALLILVRAFRGSFGCAIRRSAGASWPFLGAAPSRFVTGKIF